MELTPAELTVLGLVIERPQHGYDLEQVIEQGGIRQWTDIGFSSIYYLLAKLEKRGLVHVPDAPTAAKSRRVFHATATGREVAPRTAWALILIAEPRPVPHPLLVGIAKSLFPNSLFGEAAAGDADHGPFDHDFVVCG